MYIGVGLPVVYQVYHCKNCSGEASGQACHRLGGWPALQQWNTAHGGLCCSMQIVIYSLWTLVDICTQGTMCLLICLVDLVGVLKLVIKEATMQP